MLPHSSAITVTDQFCGAGGSSSGAVEVPGVEIRLAMNHWDRAIETHNSNFPDTLHALADVSQSDPRRYPTTDILITSPECTNHSLAKGRKRKNIAQLDLWGNDQIDPSEERSRATMWDVPRFAEHHNYRAVIVENVVDARYWVMWDAWIHAMALLGYEHEVVYLNSMFAPPTPQSRDRMYVVFWKKGNIKPDLDFRPVAYCEHCGQEVGAVQSWKRQNRKWGRYRKQYVYRCPRCTNVVEPMYFPAASIIDWSQPVERIGDRKRPLAASTLKRIQYGLDKYANQPVAVELGYTHAGDKRCRPTDGPLPTMTTQQSVGLSFPPFLMQYYTRNSAHSPIDEPVPTLTGEPRHALVMPPFLASVNYFDNIVRGVNGVFPTQTTANKIGLVIPPWLITMRGTLTSQGLDEAMTTAIASGIQQALITPPFISSYYGNNQASSVLEAIPTISGIEKHALIEPKPALEDCGFRMIQPHELQRAMAFPDKYNVTGNKREKVRQLGNAVTPPVMKMLVERVVATFA